MVWMKLCGGKLMMLGSLWLLDEKCDFKMNGFGITDWTESDYEKFSPFNLAFPSILKTAQKNI